MKHLVSYIDVNDRDKKVSIIKINNLMISKGKDYFVFYMVLFRFSLDYLYVSALKKYSVTSELLSTGLYHLEINRMKYILSWLLFLLTVFFINKCILVTKDKASEIIILGLYIMSFIPSISLFGLGNLDYTYLLYFMVFWIMLLGSSFIICSLKYKNSKAILISNSLKNVKMRYMIWKIIIFIFCFGVILISWNYSGLELNLTLDHDKIYKLRSEVKPGMLVNYFRNNAMFIVIPVAVIFCLQKRKWLILPFLVWIQLLSYGVDNQKAALFILPVSILGYIFYKKYLVGIIPKLLFLGNLAIYVEAIIGKSSFLISNLLERVYYLPAMLSNCYFEYFKDRQVVLPAVSLLEKLDLVTDYPYKAGVPYLIAGEYLHNPAISANTGMFGNAFSYGLIGVIIIPITYSFLFYLLDRATSNLQIKTYISVLIILVFVITGASIFVVLLVYGFIVTLIMLSLVNQKSKFQIEGDLSH